MNIEDSFDIINDKEIIGNLFSELDYVKNQQSFLKTKITTLVKENDLVRTQYNDLLEEKLNIEKNECEIILNLKQQIEMLTNEKDHATKLWQNSLKTIDVLEDDIRTYQSGIDGYVPKSETVRIKNIYEEKIKKLSSELSFTKEKLNESSKNNSNTIISKFSEIDKSLETQENSFKIIKNLEEEILTLQQRLQKSFQCRQSLEKQMKHYEKNIENISKKNNDYILKVKESIEVVEAALIEKDGALLREQECKAKIQELSEILNKQIDLCDEKISKETALLKNQYEGELNKALLELRETQNEITKKSHEIETLNLKCIQLDYENEKIKHEKLPHSDNDISKILILEKNLEATFQKLLLSEKQNIALTAQRDAIKNDLEEMSSHFERDLKSKSIEKNTLQQKITNMHIELQEVNVKYSKLVEEINNLNDKKELLEKKLIEEVTEKEKYLKSLHSTEISELSSIYNQQVKDLTSELEDQRNINNKWRIETRVITENLEKFIIDLKNQVHKLKRQNKRLILKLKEASKKINDYSNFLQHVSNDVNHITESAIKEKLIN